MGSTGRSTGAHLHFELRIGGRPADPMQFWN
ncbi:MAG: M23 family metallopeptidase [Defluviitaleaceae bacterium]|nr:M23 family metallopeptidase [Defluviitaleaceae bacterium]